MNTLGLLDFRFVGHEYIRFVGLSCNDIAIDAGGLSFAPWAGQIGHSIARGSPPRLFSSNFEAELPGRSAAETGPAIRYTLWRNTASIMKA